MKFRARGGSACAGNDEGQRCASAFIPGTFDPVTLGHLDIIRRAALLVDRLVIGVAINRDKGPLFTLEERVAMIEAEADAHRRDDRHGDPSCIRSRTC